MRRLRPRITRDQAAAFALVLLASFVLDTTAFLGTLYLVERSYWTLAFLAATTAVWAVCIPLMGNRWNILPMILGAVLGGLVAISWPIGN